MTYKEYFINCFNRYCDLENEVAPEVMSSYPWDINSTTNQLKYKENYQQLVEEITELGEYFFASTKESKIKYREGMADEVCDILNFTHTLLLKIGIEPQHVSFQEILFSEYKEGPHELNFDHFAAIMMKPIYHFGLSCNMLKNRPWKQSQFFVDKPIVRNQVLIGYQSMMYAIMSLRIPAKELDLAHIRKTDKVRMRFRTGY